MHSLWHKPCPTFETAQYQLSSACFASCRNPGQGARRVINLEARAAPPNQAEPAPISTSRSDGSTAGDGTHQAELDESPHVPTGVSNGDDVFQSAEDELEPNTVRAKTNAQVSSGQAAKRMAADVPRDEWLCIMQQDQWPHNVQ